MYTEGITRIAYADNFYKRKIKENLKNYSEKQKDDHINNSIETYLEKELKSAIKNNRNYFVDMYNLKNKGFKLIPDIYAENFYINKVTKKPAVNLVKVNRGEQNYFLLDPYIKLRSRLINKENREVQRRESQIGVLTEKFLMEGRIERNYIPTVFKPDVFNLLVMT